MPAEWEPHAATWLAWPHHEADWPGKMEAIRWVYGEMVRKISPGETVRLLVRHPAEQQLAAGYLQRAGCDLKKVRVHHLSDQPRLDARHRAGLCQKVGMRKAESGNGNCAFPFQRLGQGQLLAEGPQNS